MFDKVLDFLSDERVYPSYWDATWRRRYLMTLPISGPAWMLFMVLRGMAMITWVVLYFLMHIFMFLIIRQPLNFGAWACYMWVGKFPAWTPKRINWGFDD